jgi:hypothetical protein
MGIKVVPRKKKVTLTPLQQRVMRGYKDGGLVGPQVPGMPRGARVKSRIGDLKQITKEAKKKLHVIIDLDDTSTGTKDREKRAKTYSNKETPMSSRKKLNLPRFKNF